MFAEWINTSRAQDVVGDFDRQRSERPAPKTSCRSLTRTNQNLSREPNGRTATQGSLSPEPSSRRSPVKIILITFVATFSRWPA